MGEPRRQIHELRDKMSLGMWKEEKWERRKGWEGRWEWNGGGKVVLHLSEHGCAPALETNKVCVFRK